MPSKFGACVLAEKFSPRCGRGGIGEALVKEYVRRGIHAIATVLPSEASDHLSDAGITCFTLDVTVEASVLDLKAQVAALTGNHLDVLINCACVQVLLGLSFAHLPAYSTDLTAVAYVT